MPITTTIEGRPVAQFPDDTSPDVIQRVMKGIASQIRGKGQDTITGQPTKPPSPPLLQGTQRNPNDPVGMMGGMIVPRDNTPSKPFRPVRNALAAGAEGVNLGMAGAAGGLNTMYNYLNEKLKVGAHPDFFKKAVEEYSKNAKYWENVAQKGGISKALHFMGKAIGEAPAGIADFVAGVGPAAVKGAARAKERRENEIIGAGKGAAERFLMGKVLHATSQLNTLPRVGASAGVFGTQTAAQGGTPEQIGEAVITGAMYGLPGKGGVGIKELGKNAAELNKEIGERGSTSKKPDVDPITTQDTATQMKKQYTDDKQETPLWLDKGFLPAVKVDGKVHLTGTGHKSMTDIPGIPEAKELEMGWVNVKTGIFSDRKGTEWEENGGNKALVPAVRQGKTVVKGGIGDTHPDVMKANSIGPEAEHERGFVGPDGKFMTRARAKQWMKKNRPELYEEWAAMVEEGGEGKNKELHSQDLNKAQGLPAEKKKDDTTLGMGLGGAQEYFYSKKRNNQRKEAEDREKRIESLEKDLKKSASIYSRIEFIREEENGEVKFKPYIDGKRMNSIEEAEGRANELIDRDKHVISSREELTKLYKERQGKGPLYPPLSKEIEGEDIYHGTYKDIIDFHESPFGTHFGTRDQASSRIEDKGDSKLPFGTTQIIQGKKPKGNYLDVGYEGDSGRWDKSQFITGELTKISKYENPKFSIQEVDRLKEELSGIKENSDRLTHIKQWLQGKNYDGIQYINIFENGRSEDYSYIVFDPSKVPIVDRLGFQKVKKGTGVFGINNDFDFRSSIPDKETGGVRLYMGVDPTMAGKILKGLDRWLSPTKEHLKKQGEGKMPAEEWIKRVEAWGSKNPHIKDENTWNELTAWLDSKKGEKGGVKKDDIMEMLELSKGKWAVREQTHGIDNDRMRRRIQELEQKSNLTPEGKQELINRRNGWPYSTVDPWSDSNIPGGISGTEKVWTLTVPNQSKYSKTAHDDLFNKMVDKYGSNYVDSMTDKERQEFNSVVDDPNFYWSPHFPNKPNVVIHFRAQEIKDGAGEKGLLIETIQSDWHQEGSGGKAPFEKSWAEVGLKHALDIAAQDPSIKWVGWSSGKVQNERWGKTNPELEDIQDHPRYNQYVEEYYRDIEKETGAVLSEDDKENIEEEVMAEVTTRIEQELENGFLTTLYDKRLPKFAKKYVEKLGGKYKDDTLIPKYGDVEYPEDDGYPIHRIDLTTPLRAHINTKGQEFYQMGGPVAGAAVKTAMDGGDDKKKKKRNPAKEAFEERKGRL